MLSDAGLLQAYDAQLRTEAEVRHVEALTRLGPLHLATLPGPIGFITYRDLSGVDDFDALVAEALAHYADDPRIRLVEWKTRAHDEVPGLHRTLVGHGFVPDDPESIMIGEAALLAVDLPLPDGVRLRRVTSEADVTAMSSMQDEVFGSEMGSEWVLRRIADDPTIELWVAEADHRVVGAGRLEPVPGTDFAGLWGGATHPEWRGRGIYRALTAARARSALRMGKTLINSDCTPYSRPILERSGLHKISETTPYVWRR